MNYLPLSYETTAENLACEELLLNEAEVSGNACLRIWRPKSTTVVLGYANKAGTEANLEFCRANHIEIQRRLSGGGTVVLTQGCLCYSIAVSVVPGTPFEQVSRTNRFVMETHRSALQTLTEMAVHTDGVTDLSIANKKFSGNSQKRGRRALLFHGTILFEADLELISNCLRHPSSEPEWRRKRPHLEFIRNFPASSASIESALVAAWSAVPLARTDLDKSVMELAEKKYRQDAWRYCR